MHFLAKGSRYGIAVVELECADGIERPVGPNAWLHGADELSPAALLEKAAAERPKQLEELEIRTSPSIPGRDPELAAVFQDLACQVAWDLHLACEAAFTGKPYPGVWRGIEPVPDEHVRRVIAATQRELNRELRPWAGRKRPAVQLAQLPWPIQRAFAERRRLRYLQWGITKERWEANTISLFDIPEDRDWEPPFPPPADWYMDDGAGPYWVIA